MILKQSIHYSDASTQMGSNQCRMRILEQGANKWQITKTLIYTRPNGFHSVYWVDVYNNYVFYLDFAESITDEYAKIGEVIEISEPIYTEEMAKYIQNHEGVVIK